MIVYTETNYELGTKATVEYNRFNHTFVTGVRVVYLCLYDVVETEDHASQAEFAKAYSL